MFLRPLILNVKLDLPIIKNTKQNWKKEKI